VGPHPQGPWKDKLPEVLGPSDPSDWMSASTHDLLGLRGRPLCGPGTGDNMAAALGVALAPGDVAISLGTSGSVSAVSEQPTADATGAVAGFADATGGSFLSCARSTRRSPRTRSPACSASTTTGSPRWHWPPPRAPAVWVLVPYLAGERTPNRPGATGSLHGLRTDVTREQVARAAFEASRAASSTASTRSGVPVSTRRDDCCSSAAGRVRRVPPGVRRPQRTSGHDPVGREHVATGACVQAAAVLAGSAPDEVARAWGWVRVSWSSHCGHRTTRACGPGTQPRASRELQTLKQHHMG